MKSYHEYKVLGMMSGTSLDGVDLAAVKFTRDGDRWSYDVLKAETIPYPVEWEENLRRSVHLKAPELLELDASLGKYFGEIAAGFLKKNNLEVKFISSHGHTVFHQPDRGFTLQIGNPLFISKATRLPVINDFRSLDVALGGQGAPLVPVGDALLFGGYGACINLGGFSNISTEIKGKRIAYDIGPANIILNYFAQKMAVPFDKDGKLGRKGKINPDLLKELESLSYYQMPYPKSLGYEWVESELLPVFKKYGTNTLDLLATAYEHISRVIANDLVKMCIEGKVLITGGGALNSYFISSIKEKLKSSIEIVLPERGIINYKEAIIFGLLGVLRWNDEINCLGSVTGAERDSSTGRITTAF